MHSTNKPKTADKKPINDKITGWKEIDIALRDMPKYKLTEQSLRNLKFNDKIIIKEKKTEWVNIIHFIRYDPQQ